MSACPAGSTPLGGIDDLASAVVTVPTVLALFAVFLSAMQGMLALESADPCRISVRKMNILLSLELAELLVSVASEVLSFVELRSALQERLQWLHWVAPCLLAAGLLETFVDLYYTLAVVTKSRVSWLPFSASGSSNKTWEVVPFSLTLSLSLILVGWRLRWWWNSCSIADSIQVTLEEPSLRRGVMGFAVGWAVGISSLVFLVMILTDCAEDGPNYIASLPFLWKPDSWIEGQHGDIKVWYREAKGEEVVQEYVATAVLDGHVPLPETENDVLFNLERQPLHCGNAIMGTDRDMINKEDRAASRLHKVILLAEHLVVLPLLIVVVTVVSRLHGTFDVKTFKAVRQLTDAVIVIAFLEVAIGVKNVLWSVSGAMVKERAIPSDSARLTQLRGLVLGKENEPLQATEGDKP